MDAQEKTDIKKILEAYHENTKSAAKEILEKFKTNSESYGDLKMNLNLLRCSAFYQINGEKKYNSLFNEIEEQLQKEIDCIKKW